MKVEFFTLHLDKRVYICVLLHNFAVVQCNISQQVYPRNLTWYTIACVVQPDTFEAVRINVFNMLAELAQAFNEEQLDFLFKKFESSAAQCDADNKQGMLLLFRLAKVDTQVSFAQIAHLTSAKSQ